MAADQQFCLRWNNHQSTLISVFDSLLENGTLVDCTLAAEGQYLKAHKVVLSACSPYLETLLSQHYEKHPIVILKDVKFTELKSMMDYMYRGEVNISQDQLGTFLKAAESLQIKGLSDNGDDGASGSTTTKRQDSTRTSVTEVRNTESKRPAPAGDFSDASREGSISPSSSRKRRRTRRSSQGDDNDSHLDTTSNACDFPTPNQATPLSVPISTTVPTPVQNIAKTIVKQEPSISRLENNLNSTIAPESGLLKEKIEPPSEPLLEPKTEYLDYMNNENSIEVEDLTLDDDEDLDSSMDASRPGPSHDMSNQGYQWPMGDQSGTDEIFMAAQQAVGAATGQQRDSQGGSGFIFASCGSYQEEIPMQYIFEGDNETSYEEDSVEPEVLSWPTVSSSKKHHQSYNLGGHKHVISKRPKIAGRIRGKRCRVCKLEGKRKETVYFCSECQGKPSLCLVRCFDKYHSVGGCSSSILTNLSTDQKKGKGGCPKKIIRGLPKSMTPKPAKRDISKPETSYLKPETSYFKEWPAQSLPNGQSRSSTVTNLNPDPPKRKVGRPKKIIDRYPKSIKPIPAKSDISKPETSYVKLETSCLKERPVQTLPNGQSSSSTMTNLNPDQPKRKVGRPKKIIQGRPKIVNQKPPKRGIFKPDTCYVKLETSYFKGRPVQTLPNGQSSSSTVTNLNRDLLKGNGGCSQEINRGRPKTIKRERPKKIKYRRIKKEVLSPPEQSLNLNPVGIQKTMAIQNSCYVLLGSR